jgi:hypothetical protein
MKHLALAAVISLFAAAPGYAQSCKAVSTDGKALAGAAKTSFMKKCCEDSAKSAEGKALAGAAKKSYVTKCMKS